MYSFQRPDAALDLGTWSEPVLPSSGFPRAQEPRCLPIGGVQGEGSDRRVAVGFGKASRSFRADQRSPRHFSKTDATSPWRAHFGCAIWSSASSIAVVTMASSDVQEVDASKGIYAVCGQLWSGKKMA